VPGFHQEHVKEDMLWEPVNPGSPAKQLELVIVLLEKFVDHMQMPACVDFNYLAEQ